MELKTLEKIRGLKRSASQLKGFKAEYEQITSDAKCDKHGYGFNKDNRFANFKVTVSFDSWKGYYGNSGCSTFSLNVKDPGTYFVQALNEHQELLFETMANLMMKTANELKEKAEVEIQEASDLLKEL